MSNAVDTPPEVTSENVTDPLVIGHLTEAENNALKILKRQTQQIQMKIGEIEINKARMLADVSDIEIQANRLLTDAKNRCEIEDGQPWSVDQNGVIRLIPGGQQPDAG